MDDTTLKKKNTAPQRMQQLEDALYQKLLTTAYSSVSVGDICRTVGLSRNRFYKYYHSKDDCLCSIIDRIFQNCKLYTVSGFQEVPSPLEIAERAMDYWKEQREFFDIIVRNDLIVFLLLRGISFAKTEERQVLPYLTTAEMEADEDILSVYKGTQLVLLLQWYSRGFDTPSIEMAKKYLRIVLDPMINETEGENLWHLV